MWCIAHKVELTIKDALKGTAFDFIDDMLKLYYIYEKSPEKCRQLEEIIFDLKDCLKFDDKGIKPVQASGSRWVTQTQGNETCHFKIWSIYQSPHFSF
uniref:Uncharacterized protein n=1 Tax=Amphimedon queenslandica TaxID=400682 RepID=A0A1X7VGK6_AMPQE